MKTKLNMRKSDPPKVKKIDNENLDETEIKLNREKVVAATKLLPPVPKKQKLSKKEFAQQKEANKVSHTSDRKIGNGNLVVVVVFIEEGNRSGGHESGERHNQML